MSENVMVKVTVNGHEPFEVSKNTSLREISEKFSHVTKYPIVLAIVDNEVYELHRTLTGDSNINFIDITNPHGFRAYQRSAVFLMLYAIKEIYGKDIRVIVEHSINKNYYIEIEAGQKIEIDDNFLESVYNKMQSCVQNNMRIEKLALSLEEAIKKSKELNLIDKAESLHYRRTSSVNFYKIDWFYNYFYGPMVPSTGYITKFKLNKCGNGLLLQFPLSTDPEEFSELKYPQKITQVFQESNTWARILRVDTVASLNSVICNEGIEKIFRINEALHEKKIAQIADMICEQEKPLVLIAGPSSSGKTTFAQRLCIQLRVNGKRPYVISIDDYYVNRANTPRDEEGKPDYECLEAIDVKAVNEDLMNLLRGETVNIPHYNFVTGSREYKNKFLKLEKGDIIVMEGIHGLNEKMTADIAKKDKFKIFISALTQLNIDYHNHIPTTDTRLVRRIVRDNRFRGINAVSTFDVWPSVLRGENKYIFPYQEEADAFFNSALVYEMCILKQFAEPLLFNIKREQQEYTEAKRLIKFLDSFLGVSSEQVPPNSILREFIGGSCFAT